MTGWQQQGEYEYTADGYTGWYRRVDGRLTDGRWPEWNRNGEARESKNEIPAASRIDGLRLLLQPCCICGQQACQHMTVEATWKS